MTGDEHKGTPFDPTLAKALSHWSDNASLYIPPLRGQDRKRYLEQARQAAERVRSDGDPLMAALVEAGVERIASGIDVRGSKLYPNG